MKPEPAEVAGEDPGCTFGRCFCCWIKHCSSRIPPVAPGRDYNRVPLGADYRAAWSLLIGFLPPPSAGASLLRLRRFRVARSGHVLGRSDDALEILDDADYDAKGNSAEIRSAGATLSNDGRSLALCLFCQDLGVPSGKVEPPRPVELLLELNSDRWIGLHSLPHFLPRTMSIRPISAAGDVWAPGFCIHGGPNLLVMLRLDKESKQWVQVANMKWWESCVINGYAVVRDTILLSLEPREFFVVFNCTTSAWTTVKTHNNPSTLAWTLDKSFVCHYLPICGRGLYVEEDDTIYFLRNSIIYAYKLCQDQDQCQYWMALPTFVDCVCPFGDEGSGFLTHLFGRVMCFVWISEQHCKCDTSHVVITTFRVNYEHSIPKGVQVLHSTCRRLDIDPSMSSASNYTFCFLQEYEENALPPAKKKRDNEMTPSMGLEPMEVTASSDVVESSKMLTCCRGFFNEINFLSALRLDNSVIQMSKDLYIVCQAPSYSTVFKINIVDGRLACHNKNLTPYGSLDTYVCADPDDLMEQPCPWHFICDRTSIYAVRDETNDIHVLSLTGGTRDSFEAKGPAGIKFSIALVLTAGPNIIALSDTLRGVCYLSESHQWEHQCVQGSVDLEKKVELSGYVVLSDTLFMVCDGETCCCFLFDLDSKKWSFVRAYSDGSGSLPIVPPTGWSQSRFLIGRSVFVEGFIYTCALGGLQAYEVIKIHDYYYLGEKISLKFPWWKYWDRNRMCLDYVGQDSSGAIMFCVVQGSNYNRRPGARHKHQLLITTIQVNTEITSRGAWKPVAVGHVNAATSFIDLDGGPIWTRSCFAPSFSRMED